MTVLRFLISVPKKALEQYDQKGAHKPTVVEETGGSSFLTLNTNIPALSTTFQSLNLARLKLLTSRNCEMQLKRGKSKWADCLLRFLYNFPILLLYCFWWDANIIPRSIYFNNSAKLKCDIKADQSFQLSRSHDRRKNKQDILFISFSVSNFLLPT